MVVRKNKSKITLKNATRKKASRLDGHQARRGIKNTRKKKR